MARGPSANNGPSSRATNLVAAGLAATTPALASTHEKTHSLLSSARQLELEEVDGELAVSPSRLHHSGTSRFGDACKYIWVDSLAHAAEEQVPDVRVAAFKPRKRKDRDDSPVTLDGRKRGSFHDDDMFLDLQEGEEAAAEEDAEDEKAEAPAQVDMKREFAPLHVATPWESSDHRFDVVQEEEEPFQFLSGTEDDQDARLRGVTATTHTTHNNINAASARDSSGRLDVESKADESPFGTPTRKLKFANTSSGSLYTGSPVSAMDLGEFIFWPTSVAVESAVQPHSLYSWMHGAASEEVCGSVKRSSTQLDIHQLAKLAEFSGHDESVYASVWP